MISVSVYDLWVGASLMLCLPGAPDKVVALLPDSSDPTGLGGYRAGGGPRPTTAHDAVLLVDPSPGENFGHPVVLFYVDVNVTKKRCLLMEGLYFGIPVSLFLILILIIFKPLIRSRFAGTPDFPASLLIH